MDEIPILDSFYGYTLHGYKKIVTNPMYRSVVCDDETGKIVAFSPPKSVPYEGLFPGQQHLEEFVEGTMINVFWCHRTNYWIPCTRRRIGACTKFYNTSNLTFLEMFYSAVKILDISFDQIDTRLSLTFVMQHPDNRIVTAIDTPRLYLIDVFEHLGDGSIPKPWSHPLDTTFFKGFENVSFPKILNGFTSTDELETFVRSQPYTFMGVVLRDNEDLWKRSKYVNPHFQKVKQLRGNQSDIMFRYIEVKRDKKIGQYLKYFPEEAMCFQFFKECLEKIIYRMYSNQEKPFLLDFYQKKTLLAMKKRYAYKNEIYKFVTELDPKIQYKLLKEFRQKLFVSP